MCVSEMGYIGNKFIGVNFYVSDSDLNNFKTNKNRPFVVRRVT